MPIDFQSLGRHFIVGLEATTLSADEMLLLKKIRPSGIILFARNFGTEPEWRSGLSSLLQDVKLHSEGSVKLVSIDFEGGRVNRFPQDIKRFPYAQEWRTSVKETAGEMADILSQLGFNMTYGPVADLDLNRENPVIGKRAFSDDKTEAAEACINFVQANREKNVYTCGKHFPGHGRTALDSHFELPVVSCSKENFS